MQRSEPTFLMSPDDVKGKGATRCWSCMVGSHSVNMKRAGVSRVHTSSYDRQKKPGHVTILPTKKMSVSFRFFLVFRCSSALWV